MNNGEDNVNDNQLANVVVEVPLRHVIQMQNQYQLMVFRLVCV